MIFQIVMTLIFWSTILLMYIMYLNETKAKKNIILGITIPYSHQNDEPVKAAVANYKKQSAITFAILTLAVIPSAFLTQAGSMFYLLTWMTFSMIIIVIPYVIANRKLRAYKLAENLKGNATMHADLKLSSAQIKALSPYYSLIPFAISLAPVVYFLITAPNNIGDVALTSAIMPATILLCMVLHIYVNRRKKDSATSNTDINFALSEIRTKNWSKLYIGLNGILALLSLLFFATIAFDFLSEMVVTLSLLALSMVTVLVALFVDLDTRKKQREYTKNNLGDDLVVDDDDYWYFGMFYSNPNDNRLMIPDRVGTNTTVNMAKPIGRFLMSLSALCIVGLPFVGAWLYGAENAPMTVDFTDTAIVATHRKVIYDIPLDSIESMEKTDKCPEILTRVKGLASENVQRGLFKVKGLGTCEIFVSSESDEFAIIKTEDGTTYIIGY